MCRARCTCTHNSYACVFVMLQGWEQLPGERVLVSLPAFLMILMMERHSMRWLTCMFEFIVQGWKPVSIWRSGG